MRLLLLPVACNALLRRTLMSGVVIAILLLLSLCSSVTTGSINDIERRRQVAVAPRTPLQQTMVSVHRRQVTVQNNADTIITIGWIHPDTGATIPMATSMNVGDTYELDTMVNHTFVVVQLPPPPPPPGTANVAVDNNSTASQSESNRRNQHQQLPTNNHFISLDEDDDTTQEGHETNTECIVSYLTVSSDDDVEQVIVIEKGMQLKRALLLPFDTDETINLELISSSPTAAKEKDPTVELMMESCRQQYQNNGDDLTDMIHCVQQQTTTKLMELQEELAFQRDLRHTVANMNENYTCTDVTRTTTVPKRTTTWSYQESTVDNDPLMIRNVGILHEHAASQIHLINNFISEEECMAIQNAAEPILHRGAVADGKGGSTMSPNRKAWQAGVSVNDYTNTYDPIANVKRRLFAYTNHVGAYNLTLDGQEDLMSIQYFGVNSTAPRASKDDDDTTTANILSTPDQYTPHCDGDCNNMVHKHGSRIATMVMYCTIPEQGGGGTNFQQSNVYVRPTMGAGVFFSYMDPITLIHDEGFTTHSGCPVLYGTKRIVVQWMRYGVDSNNAWDSFDTNNMKLTS